MFYLLACGKHSKNSQWKSDEFKLIPRQEKERIIHISNVIPVFPLYGIRSSKAGKGK